MDDKKRFEPVISGETKLTEEHPKPPGPVKKFFSMFRADDISDMREYITKNVVVPAIEDLILKALSTYFHGGRAPSTKGSIIIDSSSYTSYGSSSIKANKITTAKAYTESKNDLPQILIKTQEDAEKVVGACRAAFDKYSMLRLGDIYDFAKISLNGNYTLYDYGWREASDVYHINAIRQMDGWYRISYPPPKPMD